MPDLLQQNLSNQTQIYKTMKKLFFFTLCLISTLSIQAQNISNGTPGTVRTSVAIGDWTNPTTWDCGCVPASDEIANIVTDSVTISTHVYIRELRSTTGGKLHMTTSAWLEYTSAFQNLNNYFLKPDLSITLHVLKE